MRYSWVLQQLLLKSLITAHCICGIGLKPASLTDGNQVANSAIATRVVFLFIWWLLPPYWTCSVTLLRCLDWHIPSVTGKKLCILSTVPPMSSLPGLAIFYPPKGTIWGNKVLEMTLLGHLVPLTADTWQSPEAKQVVLHLGSSQPCRKPLLPTAFVIFWAAGDYYFRLESSGNHGLRQLGTAKISLLLFVYLKAKMQGPRTSRRGCSTWGLVSSMCQGCWASASRMLQGSTKQSRRD